MGKQVRFYMLPEDCTLFARAVQGREAKVKFVAAESSTPDLGTTDHPCVLGSTWYIWNPAVLESLRRLKIAREDGEPIYRIHTSEPVIELDLPALTDWDGNPALTQGRIYASFDKPSPALEKWFSALATWIRRHFAKSPNSSLGGYIGPAALAWHKGGGLLLPTFKPPLTATWKSIVEQQGSGKR